jgi:hypothetical protein
MKGTAAVSTLLTLAGERKERTLGSVTGLLLFSSGICTLFCNRLFGFLLAAFGPIWPLLFCLLFVSLGGFLAWRLHSV